eukprot:1187833-Prorocentrum_minimum.AAC.4
MSSGLAILAVFAHFYLDVSITHMRPSVLITDKFTLNRKLEVQILLPSSRSDGDNRYALLPRVQTQSCLSVVRPCRRNYKGRSGQRLD